MLIENNYKNFISQRFPLRRKKKIKVFTLVLRVWNRFSHGIVSEQIYRPKNLFSLSL